MVLLYLSTLPTNKTSKSRTRVPFFLITIEMCLHPCLVSCEKYMAAVRGVMVSRGLFCTFDEVFFGAQKTPSFFAPKNPLKKASKNSSKNPLKNPWKKTPP